MKWVIFKSKLRIPPFLVTQHTYAAHPWPNVQCREETKKERKGRDYSANSFQDHLKNKTYTCEILDNTIPAPCGTTPITKNKC